MEARTPDNHIAIAEAEFIMVTDAERSNGGTTGANVVIIAALFPLVAHVPCNEMLPAGVCGPLLSKNPSPLATDKRNVLPVPADTAPDSFATNINAQQLSAMDVTEAVRDVLLLLWAVLLYASGIPVCLQPV